MKILVVQPQLPYPLDRGCFQRNFNLVRQLAQRHEVDLIALDESGERLEHMGVFQEFCQRVRVIPFQHPKWPKLFPGRLLNPLPTTIAHWTNQEFQESLSEIVRKVRYDAVWVFDIVLAQYFIGRWKDLPLIVDRSRVDLQFQQSEYANLQLTPKQKFLRWENLAKLRRFEKQVAKRAYAQTVCGPDDADFIHEFIDPQCRTEVVGNGVSLETFFPESAPDARAAKPTVLFCGAMDYIANVDALRWYFNEIHADFRRRMPDAEILIVGKNPVDEVKAYGKLPGVTVTGEVPDVRPYYRRAWIQMVPLRIGCGTRLKIPESLAMGTPVVSTTIGAQGLDFRESVEIIRADTPDTFALKLAGILKDDVHRRSIETYGLQAVRDRWSWERMGRRLLEVFDGCARRRPASPYPGFKPELRNAA